MVVVSYNGVMLVALPCGSGASVLWWVLQRVRNLCCDLRGEFGIDVLVEGWGERGVVLFEELGELLEGLTGLGDGGWAFKES